MVRMPPPTPMPGRYAAKGRKPAPAPRSRTRRTTLTPSHPTTIRKAIVPNRPLTLVRNLQDRFDLGWSADMSDPGPLADRLLESCDGAADPDDSAVRSDGFRHSFDEHVVRSGEFHHV